MKKVKVGVFALAIIALAVAIAGCGSSKTHGEEGSLTLTEPGGNSGSFGVIGKVGQKGVAPGNGFAFSSPLENAEKKAVGELNAFCIATEESSGENVHGTCSGTATVPGGGFALNVGAKSIGNNVSGAITGGTGKYAGAVGTFDTKATGSGENPTEEVTFHYTLP